LPAEEVEGQRGSASSSRARFCNHFLNDFRQRAAGEHQLTRQYFHHPQNGFSASVQATIGGKSAMVCWKDMNTLVLTTPALAASRQQLALSNPDGESASLDAAFIAQ
jgi:hypothetical protein